MNERPKNRKKQLVTALGFLAVLAAALAVVLLINGNLRRDAAPAGAGGITITRSGETLAAFTMDDVKKLDSVECYVNLSSSSGEDAEGMYTGVPLRALLAAAGDRACDGAEKIVAAAGDGYVMAYSAEEVMDDDAIILAYALDGESLGGMEDGSGPFRIIATADEFANRSLRWAVSLDVQ